MTPRRQEQLMAFDRLLTIMDELREQCPWDRKQTLESLRHLTIEETYELSDAILENDLPEIRKELGDIQLHLVFYAKIASRNAARFRHGRCTEWYLRETYQPPPAHLWRCQW